MEKSDFAPKTKKVKQKFVFISPDLGVEIFENSEDYVEEYHRAGEKAIKGGEKGANLRWGTIEQRRAEWDSWQAYINEAYRRFKSVDYSYKRLVKAVAEKFGKHPKTIKRRTYDPAEK